MKKTTVIIVMLLSVFLLNACGPISPPMDTETVSVVDQHGIRMEIVQAIMVDSDLQVEFQIDHEGDNPEPSYRLQMPWYALDHAGNRQESAHSAFYNVLDVEGKIIPNSNRLVMTFRNYSMHAGPVDIEAHIKPVFLVPDEDGYIFEALLSEMPIDGQEPVEYRHLGISLSGTTHTQPDGGLAVAIRIEAAEDILATLTYPVQPIGNDDTGQSYVSNRTRRNEDAEGVREEILYFDSVQSIARSFSVRYEIQLRASQPEQIIFTFSQIPIEDG
jgi:hypothetical protein